MNGRKGSSLQRIVYKRYDGPDGGLYAFHASSHLSPLLSNIVLGNAVSVIRHENSTFVGKKQGSTSFFADQQFVYMQIQEGL